MKNQPWLGVTVLFLATLSALAPCGAAKEPRSVFTDLLKRTPFVITDEEAHQLDRRGALSARQAKAYRDQARKALGRRKEGGEVAIDAPTLGRGTTKIVVRLPKKYRPGKKKWPAIFFLHGSNASAAGAAKKFDALAVEIDAVIVWIDSERGRADGLGWNFGPEIGSVATARRFVLLEYAVDPDRCHLWGHSNGAGGVFNVSERFPAEFVSLASFACVMRAGTLLNFRALAGRPIRIWQGALDRNPTSLPDRSRTFADHLATHDVQSEYVLAEGADHDLTGPALSDAWEARRDVRRSTAPTAITYGNYRAPVLECVTRRDAHDDARHASLGRARWVEVTSFLSGEASNDAPDRTFYHVDAKIEANTVRVSTRAVNGLTLHLHEGLIDLDDEVRISVDDELVTTGTPARSLSTLARDLLEHGGIDEAATTRVQLRLRDGTWTLEDGSDFVVAPPAEEE